MQKTERMELRMSRAERNALRLALVSHAREVSGLPIAADRTEADILRRGLACVLRDAMIRDPVRPADSEWAHIDDEPEQTIEKFGLWCLASEGRCGVTLERVPDTQVYRPTGDLEQAREALHLGNFAREAR